MSVISSLMQQVMADGRKFEWWVAPKAAGESAWDRASRDLVGRILNADGSAASSEFAINLRREDYASIAKALVLDDGRILAIWYSSDGDHGSDLYGRLFSSAGAPLGSDFLVAGGPSGVSAPVFTLSAGSKLAVTWTNLDDGGEAAGSGKASFDFAGYATPEISGGEASSFTVAENFNGVIADFDAPGTGVVYSIVAGEFADHFTIDAATGALAFAAGADYESYVYWGETSGLDGLLVRATGSNGLYDEQRVNVIVTDINEAPKASFVALDNTAADGAFTVGQSVDVSAGLAVAAISIQDDQLGAETLTLAGADAASFEIRTNAFGVPHLWYIGGAFDYAKKPVFEVSVIVDDPSIGAKPEAVISFKVLAPMSAAHGGTAGNDTFMAHAASESFNGNAGFDTVSFRNAAGGVVANLADNTLNTGLAEGDVFAAVEGVVGSRFDDTLTGNAGSNKLNGGIGRDRMAGGDGDDIYVIDNAGDAIVEAGGGGVDKAVSTAVDLRLAANIETGKLLGVLDLDLAGNGGANRLQGNGGGNAIEGGGGIDVMHGGAGADSFVYRAVADSLAGTGQDWILDFRAGEDTIDLSLIDANGAGAGDTAFVLLDGEGAAFTGAGGELRFRHGRNATAVEADLDGDRKADFAISLAKLIGLGADDFIL
jgi:Ca2+-binding RTX toxin-like protein